MNKILVNLDPELLTRVMEEFFRIHLPYSEIYSQIYFKRAHISIGEFISSDMPFSTPQQNYMRLRNIIDATLSWGSADRETRFIMNAPVNISWARIQEMWREFLRIEMERDFPTFKELDINTNKFPLIKIS